MLRKKKKMPAAAPAAAAKPYGDFSIVQPEKLNYGANSENPGTAYFQYTIEARNTRHPYRNPRQNVLSGNAVYPNL